GAGGGRAGAPGAAPGGGRGAAGGVPGGPPPHGHAAGPGAPTAAPGADGPGGPAGPGGAYGPNGGPGGAYGPNGPGGYGPGGGQQAARPAAPQAAAGPQGGPARQAPSGPPAPGVAGARQVLAAGGAPEALADQAVRALGEQAGAMLREDPWRLLTVAGVRPEQADSFARALLGPECGPGDERRAQALIGWLLEQAALAGHSALEADALRSALAARAVPDPDEALQTAIAEGEVLVFQDALDDPSAAPRPADAEDDEEQPVRLLFGLDRFAMAEESVADGLSRLLNTFEPLPETDEEAAAESSPTDETPEAAPALGTSPDAAANTGTDVPADAAADTGADVPGDVSPDTGADASAGTGADVSAATGADASTGTGADAATVVSPDTGSDASADAAAGVPADASPGPDAAGGPDVAAAAAEGAPRSPAVPQPLDDVAPRPVRVSAARWEAAAAAAPSSSAGALIRAAAQSGLVAHTGGEAARAEPAALIAAARALGLRAVGATHSADGRRRLADLVTEATAHYEAAGQVPSGAPAAAGSGAEPGSSPAAVTLSGLLAGREGPGRDADGSLALDLLVVLDAPQLDLETAALLIESLADGVRLVLSGDPGVLWSAGPGRLFADLLAARCCPQVASRTPDFGPIGELVSGIGIGELAEVEAPE
ncbi:hypothetical protein C3486_36510, partial [Streptomyces sp. Ru73]|uniref:helix-hairpin-helix domain-containing protein n=1 Tax=Streptomyces sp. Ru73 TaxID=2080748 RepID=UPI000CDD2865